MSTQRELVTIITEAVLEAGLTVKLESLGATGYTIFDVRGKGQQGQRTGDWRESANIQIEILCKESKADEIIKAISDEFFDDYAMIIYRTSVSVLRSDKF